MNVITWLSILTGTNGPVLSLVAGAWVEIARLQHEVDNLKAGKS